MYLVDGNRGLWGMPAGAALHPGLVRPRKDFGLWHHGRGSRRFLGLPRIGVGLERQQMSIFSVQRILVECACANAWDEQFPDAATLMRMHGVAAIVPAVEVADDSDRTRIGCPNGKSYALLASHLGPVSAQTIRNMAMSAFGNQMDVEL